MPADCESDERWNAHLWQGPKTPGIWNPLVDFMDVKEDGQMGNMQPLTDFYNAVRNESQCGLPNVSWITPTARSRTPPALASRVRRMYYVDQLGHAQSLSGQHRNLSLLE